MPKIKINLNNLFHSIALIIILFVIFNDIVAKDYLSALFFSSLFIFDVLFFDKITAKINKKNKP